MNWLAKTLWDLLPGATASSRQASSVAPPPAAKVHPNARPDQAAPLSPPTPSKRKTRRPANGAAPRVRPIQLRYDALVVNMKKRYNIRVRKWRSSSTGCAWIVQYGDGTRSRLIESPYPRGPMSCAIFLHEIGHHAIGFGTYRPRCLEEYHAWRWSLEQMTANGFDVTPAVQKRMAESLRYAVDKARRRGIKRIPVELQRFAR